MSREKDEAEVGTLSTVLEKKMRKTLGTGIHGEEEMIQKRYSTCLIYTLQFCTKKYILCALFGCSSPAPIIIILKLQSITFWG